MRKVGSLESVEKAESFRWYLISQDIDTKVEESGDASADVWIFNDRDWQKARKLLDQFQSAGAVTAISRSIADGKEKWDQHRKALTKKVPLRDVSTPFARRKQANVTFAMMALCGLFFLMHFIDKDRWLMRHLMISEDILASSLGIKSFREMFNGEIWRLVTPIFIHTDFFHIAFNMIWFYQFGRFIEEAMGSWKFLLLVVAVAIPSNVVFYLVSGPFFGGMSGVVYGLFFFMWAYERYSLNSPFRLDPYLAKFFAIYYVICWVLTAIGFHVANSIHGVGAFMGFVAGFVASGAWKNRTRVRWTKMGFYNALIVILLLFGGILTDYLTR